MCKVPFFLSRRYVLLIRNKKGSSWVWQSYLSKGKKYVLKSPEKNQLFLQLWREQLQESGNIETIQRAIQAFFQQLSVDIISYNLRKPGAQRYSCLYAYPAFVDVGIGVLEENFDDTPGVPSSCAVVKLFSVLILKLCL
mgnify:CR=1 FL=1